MRHVEQTTTSLLPAVIAKPSACIPTAMRQGEHKLDVECEELQDLRFLRVWLPMDYPAQQSQSALLMEARERGHAFSQMKKERPDI